MNEKIKSVPPEMKKPQQGTLIGFVTATLSFAVIYMASAAPVPLFAIYRQTLDLTHSDRSYAAVAYFAGAVTALLMFARISDHFGRRIVIFINLLLAMFGCLIFLDLASSAMLLAGRFIQGFACGLASSAVAAYVVDNASLSPAWLGSVVTGAAPMLGLAGGSLASGALRQYGSGSLSIIFVVIMAMLMVCFVMLAFSPETVLRSQGGFRSLKPQIRIPLSIRPLLPAACATFVGTWSIGGFYLPFSASMAAEQLHTDNTFVAAAVFACMMTPYLIGGSLAGRMKPVSAQRMGMVAFTLCMAGIIASLKLSSVSFFLLATVGAGIAWGIAFTGSMRTILGNISKEDRAGVLSTVFLISYSGAAIPNMFVGQLFRNTSLSYIATGYGILVFLACFITLFTTFFAEKNRMP